ncbi:hypothetical protein ZIOFF_063453 [Zingiber officinale]|uniref:Uncharacterized protein n=1 Tax=Zingiber officinale TaxID=94328 RepID=A0A8J5F2I3_ZINOF|nr:hypothetical protein ZIOFF_063453 [Zingiber officinale]
MITGKRDWKEIHTRCYFFPLDLCDACEGGFDSPLHAERCFLSAVMISRCKSQKCAFESLAVGSCRSVHKDTIVLEWNCKDARTSVVKERI